VSLYSLVRTHTRAHAHNIARQRRATHQHRHFDVKLVRHVFALDQTELAQVITVIGGKHYVQGCTGASGSRFHKLVESDVLVSTIVFYVSLELA
jgi:hypothetical protein